MSGWFAISRDMIEHPIFNGHPDRVYAWVWLLGAAAYKDTTHDVQGLIVPVKRGQLCASQDAISKGCGLSRQKLRTFLRLCHRHDMIWSEPATESTKSKTMITICNYGKYQDVQPSNQPTINQASTKEQPTINQQKKQGNNVTREQVEKDTNVSQKDGLFDDVEISKPKPPKKSRMVEGWTPNDKNIEDAYSQHLTDEDIQEIANDFQIYWADRTDKAGSKSQRGWDQAWRNRCRDIAPKFNRNRRMAGNSNTNGHGQGGGLAGAYARRHLGS